MRRCATLLVLLAGVDVAAQSGPLNCRSLSYSCSATKFYTSAGQIDFGGLAGGSIRTNFDANWMYVTSSLRVQGGTGTFSEAKFWGGVASGSNQVELSAGQRLQLASGTYLVGDGTNNQSSTHWAPTADSQSTLGTSTLAWLRAYLNYGVQLDKGDQTKWTTAPISDNTQLESQLLYNDTVQEPTYASDSRKYNPLGQAREWVVEKRVQVADIGFENTNCPLAAPGLKASGAAGVTYSCTDAAAAGQNTLSGESYRVLNTTAAAGSISIVNVSANMTKRELGPKYLQRISIPAGSNANVRLWIALVPQATSLTGVDTGAISIAGFRFSTDVPDTNWQACTGDGATTTCTDTGVAPATASNLLLEVDCRESGACVFFINGSLVVRKTTNLPGTTTQLAPRTSIEARSAAARALWYGRSAVQTN